MKVEPNKEELRMRRRAYGELQWKLLSPEQGTAKKPWLSNVLLIAVLAVFVLGVFVAAAPRVGNHAAAATNVSSPDKVSLGQRPGSKSASPQIHGSRHTSGGEHHVPGSHS